MHRFASLLFLCLGSLGCSSEDSSGNSETGGSTSGGTSSGGTSSGGSSNGGSGGTSSGGASSGGTSSGGTSSGGGSSGGASGGVSGASGDRTVGDEFFVMTSVAGDHPEFGFDSLFGEPGIDLGVEVNLTHNPSGGPQNRPYVRNTIDNTSLPEFGFGWAKENPYPGLTSGQSLFVRWSHRWIGDYDQAQKFISIVAEERNILGFQPWNDTITLRSAQDGGIDCQTEEIPLLNQWVDGQWEIRFGANGYVKIWYNNNDYDSPDAEATVATGAPQPAPPETAYIGVAGYHQGNLQDDLPREFDVTDVRWGPTFDPNWHSP
jgi:hypothetical protein